MEIRTSMQIVLVSAILAFTSGAAVSGTAAENAISGVVKKPSPLIGAATFMPTQEHPVGWRGGDGSGRFPGATPPVKWSRDCVDGKPESTGMAWMTPIPRGASSPIVVGDRIFLGFDPYGLLCISKSDGHVLWYHTHTYYEVMPDAQRKAIDDRAQAPYAQLKAYYDAEIKSMSDAVSVAGYPDSRRFMDQSWTHLGDAEKKLDALAAEVDPARYKMHRETWEWASGTPVSDGKYVYMWYSHHVGVCYDLDGNRQWATVEPAKDISANNEHGRHSSPLLVGDKFIAEFGNDVLAFDHRTGKLMWTSTMQGTAPWLTPAMSSLEVASVAGQQYVVGCRGDAFRTSDGAPSWTAFKAFAGGNATPIIEQDHIFLCDHESINQLQIPSTPGPNANPIIGKSLKIAKCYMLASPLFVDGLVYVVDDKAMLHVFDPASGTAVYTKQLALSAHVEYVSFPGCSVSPALAGRYIYIMDNQGGTLVLEPGPVYKEVGINRIETVEKRSKGQDGKDSIVYEQTVSHPVFSGKHMFIRGQQYLYCIGSR
jgi:outer membrane protein assembly factor BamB